MGITPEFRTDTLDQVTDWSVNELIDRLAHTLDNPCKIADARLSAHYLRVLLGRLRVQEHRLRAIEKAVDGWAADPCGVDSQATNLLLERHEARLEFAQQACPWDDENEHGSWMFPPPVKRPSLEEKLRIVQITLDAKYGIGAVTLSLATDNEESLRISCFMGHSESVYRIVAEALAEGK